MSHTWTCQGRTGFPIHLCNFNEYKVHTVQYIQACCTYAVQTFAIFLLYCLLFAFQIPFPLSGPFLILHPVLFISSFLPPCAVYCCISTSSDSIFKHWGHPGAAQRGAGRSGVEPAAGASSSACSGTRVAAVRKCRTRSPKTHAHTHSTQVLPSVTWNFSPLVHVDISCFVYIFPNRVDSGSLSSASPIFAPPRASLVLHHPRLLFPSDWTPGAPGNKQRRLCI